VRVLTSVKVYFKSSCAGNIDEITTLLSDIHSSILGKANRELLRSIDSTRTWLRIRSDSPRSAQILELKTTLIRVIRELTADNERVLENSLDLEILRQILLHCSDEIDNHLLNRSNFEEARVRAKQLQLKGWKVEELSKLVDILDKIKDWWPF